MKSIGDQDNDSNNSRARYSVLCFALVFFFAWNRAEAQNNSWDGLRQLSAGQTIEVVEMSLRTHRGEFVSVSEQSLSLYVNNLPVTCERGNVLRVTLHKPSHRVRNTLIGAVAGGTAGAFLSNESTKEGATIPLGALAGATLGVALPTGGIEVLYRSAATPTSHDSSAGSTSQNSMIQQQVVSKQKRKGRILGTILGASLGFAGGVAIDVHDNLFDSNAGLWIAGAAAGAVIGYLVGLNLDKRAEKTESAEMKQIQDEALRLRDAEFVRTLAKSQPITSIQLAEK